MVCLGVLDHTLDMDKALREMVRVARQDATFCIMVPNSDYYCWRRKVIKGTKQQEINETLMNLEEWQDLIVRNDLRIRNIYNKINSS